MGERPRARCLPPGRAATSPTVHCRSTASSRNRMRGRPSASSTPEASSGTPACS
jgi:hypothetical protein